jgi:hypothetical protein
MTNLTFSADEYLVDQAQAYALAHGTTLNQLFQEYLQQIARGMNASDAAEEFARLARVHPVQSEKGWRFNREEIHRRGDAP